MKHRLYRLACSLPGDPDEAQDAVQEVFVRIWSKRGNLKQIRNMEAFTWTGSENSGHCHLKMAKRRQADCLIRP